MGTTLRLLLFVSVTAHLKLSQQVEKVIKSKPLSRLCHVSGSMPYLVGR